MIVTELRDGTGDGNGARVDKNNSLRVNHSIPELDPIGTVNRIRYYKSEMLNTNVDGSVTPVEFELFSDDTSTYDIFLQRIILIMSDGTQSPSKYGALPALTNGVDLYIEQGGEKTYLLEKAKTGGNLLIQSGLPTPFGASTSVNVLPKWDSNNDALVVTMDLHNLLPDGVRLGRGVKDRIVFVVNDDLTGLTEQFLTLTGHKIYE